MDDDDELERLVDLAGGPDEDDVETKDVSGSTPVPNSVKFQDFIAQMLKDGLVDERVARDRFLHYERFSPPPGPHTVRCIGGPADGRVQTVTDLEFEVVESGGINHYELRDDPFPLKKTLYRPVYFYGRSQPIKDSNGYIICMPDWR